jgi:hypothetical protein
MRSYIAGRFTSGLFLILLSAGSLKAQNSSIDWNLSLLRGSWQYHTYDYKWKLMFESDNTLVYDGEGMSYELTPGGMLVWNGEVEEEWKYILSLSKLQITFPSGDEFVFSRDGVGEPEKHVYGKFYTENDSSSGIESNWSNEWISFDGSRRFSVRIRVLIDSAVQITEASGFYRLNDGTIILAYDDGTVGEASICHFDVDDAAVAVLFDGKVYWKEFLPGGRPIVLTTYEPIPYPAPPPPPPPEPRPLPPPVPPPPVITCPKPDPIPAQPETQKGNRDFGSTRGSQGSNDHTARSGLAGIR